jgi:hypothetical protein
MMFQPRLQKVGSKSEICVLAPGISVAKQSGAGQAKLRKIAFYIHDPRSVYEVSEFRSHLVRAQRSRRRVVHR